MAPSQLFSPGGGLSPLHLLPASAVLCVCHSPPPLSSFAEASGVASHRHQHACVSPGSKSSSRTVDPAPDKGTASHHLLLLSLPFHSLTGLQILILESFWVQGPSSFLLIFCTMLYSSIWTVLSKRCLLCCLLFCHLDCMCF